MEKQIELLGEYGIKNYTVEGGKITINGNLYLRSLTIAPEGFLKDITINGFLSLSLLTTAPEGFLEGMTINGGLSLGSLTVAPEGFLKDTAINGSLWLESLIEFPEGLFTDTIIKSTDLHLNAKMATETIVDNIYKIHQTQTQT